MDFAYTEDQHLLMTAFGGLLDRYRQVPQGVHGYAAYSAEFQNEVEEAGFLELLEQPGFGVLEGALLVEAAAACPQSVELAGSMLVRPLLDGRPGPVALGWGLGKPVRYLAQASTVCLCVGEELWVGTPDREAVRTVESVLAYPLGALDAFPADAVRLDAEVAEAIKRRTLIGIAAEAAGLMRGALESTVQYVKDRQQFGQPLGHFQAIQHRLAEDAQLVRACRWLALRAAHADSETEAATACLYAQQAMRKIITDCHQFSGAMGLTLEFPLHLWTYRLKFLQGEAGGMPAQAQRVAEALWPVKAGTAGVGADRLQIAV